MHAVDFSKKVSRLLVRRAAGAFSAFTIAELVVVVAILAILATIGFVALSWYAKDAADSRAKTNVRSIYSAIASESAITGNSPRFYVVHNPSAELSGGFVTFDATHPPVTLTGGDWNQAGTNYSAGNPDYAKLKLNPEKFKISLVFPYFLKASAAASYDFTAPSVGAADILVAKPSSSAKVISYFQAVAMQPSWSAFVVGNYPTDATWSVAGLVRDPSSPSSTGALVEWSTPGVSVACLPSAVNGYPVPWLADGDSSPVSKTFSHGTSTNVASCSAGSISLASDVSVCDSWYGWDGSVCQPSVTGVCGTANKTYAFAASSYGTDAYCSSWTPSSSPSFPAAGSSATWTCGGIYGGASSPTCSAFRSAPANCAASNQTVNGHSYSVSTIGHGSTVSPTVAVGIVNGTRTYQQTFSCSNGTVATSGSESNTANSCDSGYSWNGSSCVANSWSSGVWWACSGETATWSYSLWGTCSAGCGGWTQSRTAACVRGNDGTQSRTVQCLRYDGTVLADSDCLSAKPSSSQTCSQTTAPSCWVVWSTSQSCNVAACPATMYNAPSCWNPPTAQQYGVFYSNSDASFYYKVSWGAWTKYVGVSSWWSAKTYGACWRNEGEMIRINALTDLWNGYVRVNLIWWDAYSWERFNWNLDVVKASQ